MKSVNELFQKEYDHSLWDHRMNGKYIWNFQPGQGRKCWTLWSLVVFDMNYDPTQNNVVTVFNGRLSEALSMERRLGPIGPSLGVRGQCPRKKFWPVFVAHYESYAQDIKTVVLEIRVLMSFFREKKCTVALCLFS